PMAGTSVPVDAESAARLLRLCDLACQRSGLRFRAAREALNDARDGLARAVARDVISSAGE
ncbi:MAG: hypothetical protein M3409_00110, partial [Gemmatimonadota bacterium]|nr:hypothetical protein [Gemmatimonadota bacterium]